MWVIQISITKGYGGDLEFPQSFNVFKLSRQEYNICILVLKSFSNSNIKLPILVKYATSRQEGSQFILFNILIFKWQYKLLSNQVNGVANCIIYKYGDIQVCTHTIVHSRD